MYNIISFQESLRPALPLVLGCKDYADEEQLLRRIDRILRVSGVESLFLKASMEQFDANAAKMELAGEEVQTGAKALERYTKHSYRALRCTVLKNIVTCSYREMSKDLAMSPLYRWFCGVDDFDVIRVPGKSTLQDYAHWLPVEKMDDLLVTLTKAVANEAQARMIGLEAELNMSMVWVDTTCLKANIHFPVDWVLMRDAVRTLVANILTIRRHGLTHRISEPENFLREINALAMGMTGVSRWKAGGKKERKSLFRKMKRLSQVVENHAVRYRNLLDENWSETDLTRKGAEVILRGMDNVIEQLPQARKQAHERIIGGRKVPNGEKILSLYESEIHVVNRGKAGASVEFGNSLFLAETCDGLILDHELRRTATSGDSKWLAERFQLIKEKSGKPLTGISGDRGCDSKENRTLFEEENIFNGLCPRDPKELSRRMQTDETFATAVRRRAQTEGRVGILKNVFLEGTPRAKGFKNRQLQVAWAVLSHNLWVVARLPWVEEKKALAEVA